ncbi:hypothetical protein QJS66_23145 [Kocuria rhizophila]|nr:hypothetical protein QJS66_23145 [Kocuria rhizophila]
MDAAERPVRGPGPLLDLQLPALQYGVLGFQYGYSVEHPRGADRGRRSSVTSPTAHSHRGPSLISAEQRVSAPTWCCCSPDGFEGQGPDHPPQRTSPAFPDAVRGEEHDRGPALHPANHFHMLRRQAQPTLAPDPLPRPSSRA